MLGWMRKNLLRRETRRWVDEDLIEPFQAERILNRYGTSLKDTGPSALGLLTGLAGLFAGLALLLLVSANWEQLPRLARFAGLVTLTAVLNGWGVLRLARAGSGGGLLFLGGFAYGASIMLTGQMYHLGEHFPNGLLLWALGLVPLTLLSGGRLLALQGLAVAVAWMLLEYRFAAPWLMPLFLAVAFWVAWRRRVAGLALATLAATALWLNLMLAWVYATDFGPQAQEGMISFNLGLLVLAGALAARPAWWSAGAGNWMPRLTVLAILPFTFVDGWEHYLAYAWTWLDPGLWAALVALLAAALLGRPLVAPAVAALLIAVHTGGVPDQALVWAVASNLLLLLLAMHWMRRGLLEGEGGLYVTGLVAILILALLRYLDLIGGYLGAAGLFLGMAALLFVAGRYWRRREARS
ncbi:MAG: DUF2157 domain-containing protein [Alloalcanivorax venustensis]|uniref:DUF2157 domain-containing protein n=1 Tax=Alloalcanivorax venustensis TaxID=172371 RepID=UPI003001CC55